MSGGAGVATVTRFVDNECIDHGQRMRLEGSLSSAIFRPYLVTLQLRVLT